MNLTAADVGRVVMVREDELGAIYPMVLVAWDALYATVAFPDTCPPALTDVEWTDVAYTNKYAELRRREIGPAWVLPASYGEKDFEPTKREVVVAEYPDFILGVTLVFEPAESGGYSVYVAEVPGANSQGETLARARFNAFQALRELLEYRREKARLKARGQDL